jgi:hypothetical protein
MVVVAGPRNASLGILCSGGLLIQLKAKRLIIVAMERNCRLFVCCAPIEKIEID